MAAIGARPVGALRPLGWGLRPRSAEASRGYRLRRARIRRRRAAGLSLAVVLIAAAALLASLYLAQSSRITGTGYEITRLEARLESLEAERQNLLLEIGRAQSPATIEARATQLGLAPLPDEAVHFASPLSDSHP
jgi:cell division protein FtsL